jgi:hypothetical protein
MLVQSSVSDPDPHGSARIRIDLKCRIRVRIGFKADPHMHFADPLKDYIHVQEAARPCIQCWPA